MDETSGVRAMPGDGKASVSYVVRISLVAALGGLLFGYDTAVIAGAIDFVKERFSLGELAEGWVTSSVLVGCMAGSAAAGIVSDLVGRKRVLIASAILFALSAVGSALPRTEGELVIARLIGGLGVGAASMLSPLYIAEVSPARIRGQLVSVYQLAIVFGMLVVYFVNAWIQASGVHAWDVEQGWRWMFGSEALPAIAFLALLFIVPESPRWLVKQGREAEAEAIVTRTAGADRAEAMVAEVREILAEERGGLAELLRPAILPAVGIAVVLAFLQQVTGINAILYYAPKVFKSAGLEEGVAFNDTVLVGLVNFVFTIVAITVVDRVGRRPMLLVASAGMGVSLLLLGFAFRGEESGGSWVLVCILFYIAFFAVAMGPFVWVLLSEFFPTRVRGTAMSIATFVLWLSCFTVAYTFPSLHDWLGAGPTFWVYGAMCVVAFVFIAAFVPETRGRTLEEIERSWHGADGVEPSEEVSPEG